MKKVALVYLEDNPKTDALKYNLKIPEKDCYQKTIPDDNKYDLVILSDCNIVFDGNVLKCHHSLLPSFNGDEPEKETILAGVKVSGITILYNNKIIAQYPLFITPEMHYEELKQELDYLEQIIYPIVVEKVIKKEPFEIQKLLSANSCCSGGCSGCKH